MNNMNYLITKINPDKIKKNHYMDFNISLLKMCFLWPLDSKNNLIIFLYRLTTCITCFILMAISICMLMKMFVGLDLQELSSTVDIFTLTASACYKQIYLIWNMKYLLQMVNTIHYKFEEKPIKEIHTFRMSNYIKYCKYFSIAYVMSAALTSTFWCFTPLVFLKPDEPLLEGEPPVTLKNRIVMPMNIWLPFDFVQSPNYEVVYWIETYAFFASAILYLSIDSFYFFMIYAICGQLELIELSFKSLFIINERMKQEEEQFAKLQTYDKNSIVSLYKYEKNMKAREKQRLHREKLMNEYLESIVRLHATVLELIRVIEIVFSSAIVVDFLHAILSLSFALFQTQMTVSFLETLKMYIFIFVCIIHQFLNNLFGEQIIYWQHRIVNAVYESPWYTSDKKFKRSIRIITAGSACPIKLSGFKMYILCLQSFLEFCRRIFSYYTVLSEVSAAK